MEMYEYIGAISVIISIMLPLFRYKSKYFLYFSFFAINDLLGYLFHFFFSLSIDTMWIPIHYLLLFSLDEKFFVKYKTPILLGFLPTVILGYIATNEERILFVTIIHSLILLWFIKDLIEEIIIESKVNLFTVLVILYESIIVFKSVSMVNDVKFGMEVFYVGTAVQIFVGLFIILMRKDIKISLGKDDISLEP